MERPFQKACSDASNIQCHLYARLSARPLVLSLSFAISTHTYHLPTSHPILTHIGPPCCNAVKTWFESITMRKMEGLPIFQGRCSAQHLVVGCASRGENAWYHLHIVVCSICEVKWFCIHFKTGDGITTNLVNNRQWWGDNFVDEGWEIMVVTMAIL